ncbi:hypothetical protein OE88DRAFT_1665674 [Heliocybe sulcata]|uniref:RBR-type E3 ubiquitin transferase n=1 Tax=Heliocybe sulcata TaxID=5364 RepID=A0A5C3MSU3_9AGAM|nr:hypothetical protein OE88DRAFT_1665674 [Heliocybe sulcata]
MSFLAHCTAGRPTGHDCVVCQEPIMNVEIRAPCGHYYDKTCALQLFEASTRDESLHPPRCCRQPIPLRIVQFHMSNELAKLFDEKSREFGTLKRVYCSNPTCSHFLGEQIDKSVIYTCPKPSCSVRTCGRCKARMTSGTISHICKEDGADQDVLNMGDREGWARCPGCDALIELNLGCYHMTCRCKTEFCYLCKARWKNCQCPQWDERHLLIAAEERVDRELGAPRRPGRVEDAPAVARLPQVRPAAAAQRQPPVQLNPVRPAGPVRVAAQQPAAVARPVPVVTPPRLDPYGSVERRTQDRPQQFDARADPRLAAQPRVAELAQITATRREGQGARGTDAKGPTGTRAEGMQSLTRRERMIREAVEELRVNHDCQHDRWRYRPGGGVCQTCYNRLPSYLFVS